MSSLESHPCIMSKIESRVEDGSSDPDPMDKNELPCPPIASQQHLSKTVELLQGCKPYSLDIVMNNRRARRNQWMNFAKATFWAKVIGGVKEGLDANEEGFVKFLSNLNVFSYKTTKMDDKSNFFNVIRLWLSVVLQIQRLDANSLVN